MVVDILIILFLISSFFRGQEIGFVRQAFSSVGFIGGLLLGSRLQHYLLGWTTTALSQSVLTLIITLGTAMVFLIVGEYIGILIKRKVLLKKINAFDNGFGGALGVITLLATIWLGASIITSLPYSDLRQSVDDSKIVSLLNKRLPSAPRIIADISKLVNPNGFPDVFIGGEPNSKQDVPLPDLGALQTAVTNDRPSVVKLEGQGCGGVVDGSGFVIGSGLVATNAHVIAGIHKPYVVDSNGTHGATPLLFDPKLDFAILRVPNLAGGPLQLNTADVVPGTAGATLGYPGGGGFDAEPSVVMEQFNARGRDIYGKSVSTRSVYEVRAKIIPGNSGGPIIDADGKVMGVVFAQSTTYDQVGYALTAAQVASKIAVVKQNSQPVSTGSCTE
ncbi:MAG: serine protease [Candidatus Saccharibacteria bacterium]|nr:serine protease [Candidatus Saccharibacteria bacterium]